MQIFALLLRSCLLLGLSTGSLGQSVPASALEELRVEFHEFLDYGPQVIRIPNAMVGYVIGKGGESITNIQRRTGCRVQIQKEHEMAPGETMRKITLSSPEGGGVAECKAMILRMVNPFKFDKFEEEKKEHEAFRQERIQSKIEQAQSKHKHAKLRQEHAASLHDHHVYDHLKKIHRQDDFKHESKHESDDYYLTYRRGGSKSPAPSVQQEPCGDGEVRGGKCADPALCCSEWGWCGSSPLHCAGAPTPPTGATAAPSVTTGGGGPTCCAEGYTGRMPYDACAKSYACHNGAFVDNSIASCGAGYLFDFTYGYCNYAQNVICRPSTCKETSAAPTAGPTSSPTVDPCPGLPKKKCVAKAEMCNWDQVKKMKKMCLPKKEQDCTQHMTFKTCKKATMGACIFDSGSKLCRHRCEGEPKKKKCNKIQNLTKKKIICKFKAPKNPCFKCHSKSICG